MHSPYHEINKKKLKNVASDQGLYCLPIIYSLFNISISIDIYSSYGQETNIWMCDGQTVYGKNRRNLPICDPKPDAHNINAHTKLSENLLIITHVIVPK